LEQLLLLLPAAAIRWNEAPIRWASRTERGRRAHILSRCWAVQTEGQKLLSIAIFRSQNTQRTNIHVVTTYPQSTEILYYCQSQSCFYRRTYDIQQLRSAVGWVHWKP